MKKNEQPIPLRSIIILPRWMMIGGVALASACMLAGIAMAVYAIGWEESGQRGGWIGSAIGCLFGGGGALLGTVCDWRRRLPATIYLRHINNDKVSPMYRKVFWPAVVACTISLFIGCFVWNNPLIWHGIVQTSGILLFISGTLEAMRRHTTRQARAVFAMYADGALEQEDTAAIDDARAKDAKFDDEVLTYLEISEKVTAFAAGI
tara:strand:+ start:373 stop:990 length:618 start_codon:yes stop_codon:yes gene_type:complete